MNISELCQEPADFVLKVQESNPDITDANQIRCLWLTQKVASMQLLIEDLLEQKTLTGHDIEPCPFCGHESAEYTEFENGFWSMTCLSCAADGPWGAEDKISALTKWNKRTPCTANLQDRDD